MWFEADWVRRKRAGRLALIGAVAALSASVAFAQAPAPSTNAMVNLIELLVKQHTITQAAGNALISQATTEAQQAQQAQAAAAAPAQQQVAGGELPPPAPGSIRVPYIPDTVRQQIKDELKGEVLAEAKAQGWAAPGFSVPEWTNRIKISGDFRFRDESDFYSRKNANDIVNFAAINAAGPFNFNANPLVLPFANSTQDRTNRLRIRARLGVDAQITPQVTAGFRLATGDDRSPISTNQNLGGGLAKRNIWLDRAFLNIAPKPWVNVSLGRFANPFRSTDLLFDEDLNFDGAVINLDAKPLLGDNAFVRIHGGAFPLDFGSQDYPDSSQLKTKYPQRWLFSGQIEGGATLGSFDVRASAAYHVFHNIRGELSDSCAVYAGVTQCSTDPSQAAFLRQGNTLFAIRNIAVDPNLPAGSIQPNPQFLGLTFPFHVLDVNGGVSVPVGDSGMRASLDGDYVRNLAFHKSDACRYGALLGNPINNVQAITYTDGSGNPQVNENPCSAANPAKFLGGGQGFMVRGSFGYAKPIKWPEWNLTASYRYLQSDAVLDSFTDSDFHYGGTNNKGYTLAGTLGLYNGTSIGVRWLSANEIVGRPLAIDVLQFDLKAEF